MKSFSKQFIRENSGCYHNKKDQGREAFIYAKVNALDFMQGKESQQIPYTHILESAIPVKDKYWFFCKKVFTKEQNQNIAIGVASIVLEIYEKKYPNDDRPRKAIQAAQDYLDGTIDRETLLTARMNAAAADDAVQQAL